MGKSLIQAHSPQQPRYFTNDGVAWLRSLPCSCGGCEAGWTTWEEAGEALDAHLASAAQVPTS